MVVGLALAQGKKPLTNADVVQMAKAGLDETMIIKVIEANDTAFDVSPQAVMDLKNAGVSQPIIEAMLAAEAKKKVPDAAAKPAKEPPPAGAERASIPDPNDPGAPHDPGIYMYTGNKLVMLEPTVYAQGKVGGFFKTAATYGIAKTKWKAVVQGPHAKIGTSDPGAVFYFYVEEKGTFGGTTSPNEFALIRFDVKGDSREATVMQIGLFGGTSGTQDKANIPCTSLKIKPGIYKVTPNAPLKPGEYAFLSASATPAGALAPGAAGASRLFDFGVNPPK